MESSTKQGAASAATIASPDTLRFGHAAVDMRPLDGSPAHEPSTTMPGFSGASPTSDLDDVRLASATANQGPVYVFPKLRVLLAIFLLVLGFCMVIAGIAVESVAVGIVGAVLTLPGGYMSFVYCMVWRGDPRFRPQDWLVRRDEFELD